MVYEGITIQGISYANVPLVWDEISEIVAKSVLEVERSADDVFADLCEKKAQLWIGRRGSSIIACMVTRIVLFPAGKVALIEHVAGEFEKAFIGYLPRLEVWAKGEGATHLRIIGRAGWVRVLKGHFEATYQILEKKL